MKRQGPNLIKELKTRRSLTQSAIAKRVGISQQAVFKLQAWQGQERAVRCYYEIPEMLDGRDKTATKTL